MVANDPRCVVAAADCVALRSAPGGENKSLQQGAILVFDEVHRLNYVATPFVRRPYRIRWRGILFTVCSSGDIA